MWAPGSFGDTAPSAATSKRVRSPWRARRRAAAPFGIAPDGACGSGVRRELVQASLNALSHHIHQLLRSKGLE